MNCPACGTPTEPGRKFCAECGHRLIALCPSCGATNSPTARFCGDCGYRLIGDEAARRPPIATVGRTPDPARAPVAERRLVTVLFADLVGFTALAEGRDAEAVRELLTRYFDMSREIIDRYGGTVEKFIGDAVMAVWGAPVAHEDDAERARPRRPRAGRGRPRPRAGRPGPRRRADRRGRGHDRRERPGDGRRRPRQHRLAAPDRGRARARSSSASATQRAASGAIAFEPVGRPGPQGQGSCRSPPGCALRVVEQAQGSRPERPARGAVRRSRRGAAPAQGPLPRHRPASSAPGSSRSPARPGSARAGWRGSSSSTSTASSKASGGTTAARPAYGEGVTFWALGEMVRVARRPRSRRTTTETTRTKVAEMLATHVPDEGERAWIEPAMLALLGRRRRAGRRPRRAVPRVADVLRTARVDRHRRPPVRGPPMGGCRASSTSSTTCSNGAAASRS